ncbi:MAG: hypothetical protein WBH57_03880 [Anaerolineae bacterium]
MAQRDSESQGGVRPTSGWGVVVGMYGPECGERLPIVKDGREMVSSLFSLARMEVKGE